MITKKEITGFLSSSADFARHNVVLLLTVISFFVIGFDLTTEIAESNNEVEYCTAILISAAKPDKPPKTSIAVKDLPKKEKVFLVTIFPIITEEYSNPFLSRPPPEI